MALSRVIVASLLAVTLTVVVVDAAKIAAFNIQVLGVTKMGKPEVVNVLTEIITRYDLVVIQEIRDSSQTAIQDLLSAVDNHSRYSWNMALGPRVGRTSCKEQYAYFYREDKFRVDDSYTYSDPGDKFEREPFVALFSSIGGSTSIPQFSVIGLHSKPDDAVSEINLMTEVYNNAVSRFGISNSILLGDFNADCNYVKSSEWSAISLKTDSRFKWLIPDSADTTVKSTDCAYDRIVLAGAEMHANRASGYVFNYQTYYDLTTDEAEDVSDHYPVYFNLY